MMRRYLRGWTPVLSLFLPVLAMASVEKPLPPQPQGMRALNQIRVRIAQAQSVVEARAVDLEFYAGGAQWTGTSSAKGKDWEFRCERGRIRGSSKTGNARFDLPEPVRVRPPAGIVQINGRPYREDVLIYSDGSLCEAVNELHLEKYLEGLVNTEFNSKWAAEAVAAQVIAARTYAVYQIRTASPRSHYDLDSTDQDQVYDGFMKEDYRASQIVSKTKGMVLFAANGSLPIKAFYHSTCGGMTELPQSVWGKPFSGFRSRVNCPFCHVSPSYRWSVDLSEPELRAIIRAIIRESKPSLASALRSAKLLSVRVLLEIPSIAMSRVRALDLVWSAGTKTYHEELPATELRRAIGAKRMRSTAFALVMREVGGSKLLTLQGRGNGHGVGMCQWGAKVMGEKGYLASAILKHYYPDSFLKKLW